MIVNDMIINGLYEENIFTKNYPFRIVGNTFDKFLFPAHWHHAIELVYPLTNSYTVTVNDQEYRIEERDILFIAGGDIHSFNTSHNPGSRYFIQFDISTLDVFGQIHNFSPFLSMTQLISAKNNSQLHHQLEMQIMEIMKESEQKFFAYNLSLNARVFDILVLLSRNVLTNDTLLTSSNYNKKFYVLEKLNTALQYIEENYQNNITLKEASAAIGFSEHHFSRVFKEMTGHNFHTYVNSRRVKKAEKLLINHDLSIIELATRAGFNSIATFNRIFKKVRGCTPMEYKKLQE